MAITIQWNKAPSVCGPKQFEYTYLDSSSCRWWIVWNFAAQQYCVHNDQSKDEAYFDSVHKAKRWFIDNILPIL